MDVIDGWNDKNMDWNNPQPENIYYIQALYQAVMQRFMPINTIYTSELRQFPIDNCICVINYLNRLTDVINYLLGTGKYVDGEYSDYVGDKQQTAEKPFKYSAMPKKLDVSNFSDIEEGALYHLSGGSTREEVIKLMKLMKKVICRIRYTKFTGFGNAKVYNFSASNHDPPSVAQSLNNCKDIIRKLKPNFYKKYDDSLVKHYVVGTFTTHYNDTPGYCGYIDTFAIQIQSLFNQNYIPQVYCLCYSSKMINTGKIDGSYRYSRYIQQSEYDSGSLGFKQGFNKISLGKAKPNEIIRLGKPHQFLKNPKTPKTNFSADEIVRHGCAVGCDNYMIFICDWGVEGGFKFR